MEMTILITSLNMDSCYSGHHRERISQIDSDTSSHVLDTCSHVWIPIHMCVVAGGENH